MDRVPRARREPAARSEVAASLAADVAGVRPGRRALSPEQERRNLAVLWLGCYLTAASWSLVLPFMPILLRKLGVPADHLATWTGLAFSAAFATAIFASPIWGAWADAVGRRVNLLRSGIAITVVMLGLANAGSPGMVLLWRLLNGALSGFIPAAYALVAATVPSARLGRSLGVLQSAPAAGTITGPLIGGALVQLWGVSATFYLAAAAELTATALVFALVREPDPPRRGMRLELGGGFAQAFANPRLRAVLGVTVLVQLALTIIEPLITIYVGEFPGVTAVPFLAGLLFSLVGLAAVLCSPVWGRWGERAGYRRVALLGLAGAAVGNGLQFFAGTIGLFGAVRLATGVAYAGANTGLSTLCATAVDADFRGRAYGFLTSGQQLGNLCGPLIGGVWGDAYGIRSSFPLSALIFGVALLLLAAATASRRLGPGDPVRTRALT